MTPPNRQAHYPATTELLSRSLAGPISDEHAAAFSRIVIKADALAETVRSELSGEFADRAVNLVSQALTVAANALGDIGPQATPPVA